MNRPNPDNKTPLFFKASLAPTIKDKVYGICLRCGDVAVEVFVVEVSQPQHVTSRLLSGPKEVGKTTDFHVCPKCYYRACRKARVVGVTNGRFDEDVKMAKKLVQEEERRKERNGG